MASLLTKGDRAFEPNGITCISVVPGAINDALPVNGGENMFVSVAITLIMSSVLS